jgi:hypothetical protein
MDLSLNLEQSDLLRPAIVAKVAADKALDHDVALLLAGMGVPWHQWTQNIKEENGLFVFVLKDPDGEV